MEDNPLKSKSSDNHHPDRGIDIEKELNERFEELKKLFKHLNIKFLYEKPVLINNNILTSLKLINLLLNVFRSLASQQLMEAKIDQVDFNSMTFLPEFDYNDVADNGLGRGTLIIGSKIVGENELTKFILEANKKRIGQRFPRSITFSWVINN